MSLWKNAAYSERKAVPSCHRPSPFPPLRRNAACLSEGREVASGRRREQACLGSAVRGLQAKLQGNIFSAGHCSPRARGILLQRFPARCGGRSGGKRNTTKSLGCLRGGGGVESAKLWNVTHPSLRGNLSRKKLAGTFWR